MSVPSQRTIKREIKKLREQIDKSEDPIVRRISYAMETALRWSILDTKKWSYPAQDARDNAHILRTEIEVKQ